MVVRSHLYDYLESYAYISRLVNEMKAGSCLSGNITYPKMNNCVRQSYRVNEPLGINAYICETHRKKPLYVCWGQCELNLCNCLVFQFLLSLLILVAMKFNFRKYSVSRIDSLGVPYDYGSVMHYGAASFSKDGRSITIHANGKKIGQRYGLSNSDKKQARKLYGCTGMLCSLSINQWI